MLDALNAFANFISEAIVSGDVISLILILSLLFTLMLGCSFILYLLWRN